MDNRRNYYRILQVQPDAPAAVIKASFRALMMTLRKHPDLGGSTAEAALINSAYETLIDTQRRAAYDRELQRQNISPVAQRRLPRAHQQPHRQTPYAQRKTTTAAAADGHHCPFCNTPHVAGMQDADDTWCSNCAAPLTRVKALAGSTNSQRKALRFGSQKRVSFFTQWPQTHAFHGDVRDLSPAGMQFTTTRTLSPQQILKIDSDVLRATGRVVSCSRPKFERQWRVGVEFVTLALHGSQGIFVSQKA